MNDNFSDALDDFVYERADFAVQKLKCSRIFSTVKILLDEFIDDAKQAGNQEVCNMVNSIIDKENEILSLQISACYKQGFSDALRFLAIS